MIDRVEQAYYELRDVHLVGNTNQEAREVVDEIKVIIITLATRLREDQAVELEALQAIKQAAWEFVNADGRHDPQGKYEVLKKLVNEVVK